MDEPTSPANVAECKIVSIQSVRDDTSTPPNPGSDSIDLGAAFARLGRDEVGESGLKETLR